MSTSRNAARLHVLLQPVAELRTQVTSRARTNRLGDALGARADGCTHRSRGRVVRGRLGRGLDLHDEETFERAYLAIAD
jgi:hypothetical protein